MWRHGGNWQYLKIMLKSGLWLVTCKYLNFASILLASHSPSLLVFMLRIMWSQHAKITFTLSMSLLSSKSGPSPRNTNTRLTSQDLPNLSIVADLRGCHQKKGTTPKCLLQSQKRWISKLTDFTKQIVWKGVIGPAELKFGLLFELSPLLHCHFCFLVQNYSKTRMG